MAAAGIPFLPDHWYYNTETGQLTKGNNLENLGNNLLGGLGWHELNIPGSASEAQAAAEAVKEFPKGKTPTTAGITPARVASTAVQQAGGSVPGVTGFLSDLTSRNLWLRVAKVIVGVALVLIGVAQLSRAQNIAKTAVKGAVLA